MQKGDLYPRGSDHVPQKLYCQICGEEFLTHFRPYKGRVCSDECFEELEWRKFLAIRGKAYYPDPKRVKAY